MSVGGTGLLADYQANDTTVAPDAYFPSAKVVGGIDPTALQLVVRQLVQDMLATELHPMLQQHAAHEIIEVSPDGSDAPLSSVVESGPTASIDPNLYEVESTHQDMQRIVGTQEANLGGTSGATATTVPATSWPSTIGIIGPCRALSSASGCRLGIASWAWRLWGGPWRGWWTRRRWRK